MNKDKEIVIWDTTNKELKKDTERAKDLNIRLLVCQLKTDIDNLKEKYNV